MQVKSDPSTLQAAASFSSAAALQTLAELVTSIECHGLTAVQFASCPQRLDTSGHTSGVSSSDRVLLARSDLFCL